MAQMIVRNIDEDTAERFTAAAKAQGKSVEQLLRELIEREARSHIDEALRNLDAIRRTTRGRAVVDPVKGIRQDREADHTGL